MNLMFQPQFEPLIVSGRKPHTIRPKRKIPLKVGQTLSLRVWTGKPYRSPQREFLRATVEKVVPVHLSLLNDMTVDGVKLTIREQNDLAYHDGFPNADALYLWFLATHGLPFEGELIHWKPHGPQT
jgi:uncharacterized protein YqfB (UPF0267 family)